MGKIMVTEMPNRPEECQFLCKDSPGFCSLTHNECPRFARYPDEVDHSLECDCLISVQAYVPVTRILHYGDKPVDVTRLK